MKFNTKNLVIILLIVFAVVLILPKLAKASTTTGVIDNVYKYAWGEDIGWINFRVASGNVEVTDTGLTGYAWNENYGWINLNPLTSGVKNNGYGDLSGYAWAKNLGWVDFSNVSINHEGVFNGYAVITSNLSQISFNCANTNSCASSDFKVRTDWRPRSARPVCNNNIDDDGDGLTDYPADPGCSNLDDGDETNLGSVNAAMSGGIAAPLPYFSILINNGAATTSSLKVILTLNGGSDSKYVWLTEDISHDFITRLDYQAQLEFLLSDSVGEKTIYAKFCNQWGWCSEVVKDSITFQKIVEPIEEEVKPKDKEEAGQPAKPPIAEPPIKPEPTIKPVSPIKQLVEKLKEIISPLVSKLAKLKPATPSPVNLEELVRRETPLALRGIWQLLPKEPIDRFVLAPLPAEFKKLANKFPSLNKIFEEVKISKLSDIKKLSSISLTLPGLTESANLLPSEMGLVSFYQPGFCTLPSVGLETEKFSLLTGIPVVKLTPEIKKKIPSEVVFAKAGGGLIDYEINLTVDSQGRPRQKITALANQTLELVVKTDGQAEIVKGYLVFKSKNKTSISNQENDPKRYFSLPQVLASVDNNEKNQVSLYFVGKLEEFLSSYIFAKPSLAYPQETPITEEITAEEKLVLQEFNYSDVDNDGIWTAEITTPAAEGEYEVITVLYYKDEELGTRAIRLTTVIDPEGYIYEKYQDKEIRVPEAIISLYSLDPATSKYQLWSARDYLQENPQVTDLSGKYAFLVPPGTYYIKVEAPGYQLFESMPFPVISGSGIHANIELKAKYWWIKIFDWKNLLLILIIILLLYNFYRDRYRDKLREESNLNKPQDDPTKEDPGGEEKNYE